MKESGEVGEMELEIFEFYINKLDTYEKERWYASLSHRGAGFVGTNLIKRLLKDDMRLYQ